MKLAFCLYKYFPYGGLQRDFLRIAEEALRRGYHIDVYTLSWEGEIPKNLNILFLPEKGLQNHRKNLNFHLALTKALSKTPYDLVIGFNKIPGVDVYYAADTCFLEKIRNQKPFWYPFLPRIRQLASFEKAVFQPDSKTQILLLSPNQQKEFEAHYQTPADRFHLLPPVIAKDRLLPGNHLKIRNKVRQKWNVGEQHFLLLMVGSGFKTKGLDRVLKGLASLPETLKTRSRLFIIGKDNPKKFLKLATKLKLSHQILFLGGQDNVPDFLMAADLLLHPAYNENTGTVLLEALIYGLPVLTTANCGYANHVKNAKGGKVLDLPFDQATFNHTLHDMLVSDDRALWKENAVHYTQKQDLYTMPEQAVNFLELIRANHAIKAR